MPKPTPEPQWPFFELFGYPISQTKAIYAEIEDGSYGGILSPPIKVRKKALPFLFLDKGRREF